MERVFQEHFHIDLISVTAGSVFLSKLKGVIDPERKRKIIGKTFIEVYFLRKIPATISPNGQQTLMPIPTFECSSCGFINDEFKMKEIE